MLSSTVTLVLIMASLLLSIAAPWRACTRSRSWILLPGECETPKLGRAFLRLVDTVVLVLSAVPVTDAQVLVRIGQLHIGLLRVPRFLERGWIVDPHVHAHRLVINLLPDLHGFHLVGVVRLGTLIDAGSQLIRVNHQLLSVPEADRVAVVEWIPVRLRDVVAAIGTDPPDVVDHLVDQPRLVWCDDELAQKRLCQPAGMARR